MATIVDLLGETLTAKDAGGALTTVKTAEALQACLSEELCVFAL